ncbi:hypothetical protein E2C01_074224 [Portunus trituberculatus]|uniref:Uncharacterized protein n=1 Tax=Portunus trituberculatus TaxID=210409 RepID=A0A5B7IBL7_PORTR|nr:hypothetical protein [Portunus trituberculatus]
MDPDRWWLRFEFLSPSRCSLDSLAVVWCGVTPEGVQVSLEVRLSPSSVVPDQWVGWDSPLSAARW